MTAEFWNFNPFVFFCKKLKKKKKKTVIGDDPEYQFQTPPVAASSAASCSPRYLRNSYWFPSPHIGQEPRVEYIFSTETWAHLTRCP